MAVFKIKVLSPQMKQEKPTVVRDRSQPYKIAIMLVAFAYVVWRAETIVRLLQCQ